MRFGRFGPSALLLKSVRHNSETISLWGKIGRFIGALAWPVVAIVGFLFLVTFYLVESPDIDAANYDSEIDSFDHVDHFPDEVSEENGHHFYGRRDSRGLGSSCHHIPPGNTVFLSLDLSPQEAEAGFQRADRQASHVVAYTDSTSTILEHRSGPEPSEAPLDFTAGRRAPVDQADYVAYFFESAPDSIRRANRSDTVAVDDNPTGETLLEKGNLSYGIAFHESQSRVLYWTRWATCVAPPEMSCDSLFASTAEYAPLHRSRIDRSMNRL